MVLMTYVVSLVMLVRMEYANVEIILPALAALLYASTKLAWHPEMILQTTQLEQTLVKEWSVPQTVITV